MTVIGREAALQDISQLVEIITESHPDPFRLFSSRIAFYERAEAIAAELKGDTVTRDDVYLHASRVSALVGDGHTSIDQLDDGCGRLWIEVEPCEGGLVVTGVYGQGKPSPFNVRESKLKCRRPGRDFRLSDFEPGSLPLCRLVADDRAAY